ncbi:hypothetical protein [Mesorhizobium sp. M1D.F.Ca.ET.234.01.1.1]|uniref:hypothetical protein n=1 Tax=unclassified Mesorhizobium TaxID=325217 RepID=UPI0026A80BD8
MAAGINIGDEVAVTATVRRRVTEDRVSVSIPSYGFPHSIVDRTSKVEKGQQIELVGDVTHVEGDWVTVKPGCPGYAERGYAETGNSLQAAFEEDDPRRQADLKGRPVQEQSVSFTTRAYRHAFLIVRL